MVAAAASNHAANGATSAKHAANGAASNGSQDAAAGRNHVVIFPFMAKGHMLPLFHFATALTAHHPTLRVTLVTTPANASFAQSRLPPSVDLVSLPFPSLPPLPAGVESTDAVPSPSLHLTFLHATSLLRDPFAAFLASLPSLTSANPPPPPTTEPGGALFHVPGMPDHVQVAAEELPYGVAKRADPDNPVTRFFAEVIGDSDVRSWGVLVNSLAALDGDYVSALESFYGPGARAWLAGPMFLAATVGELDGEQDPEGCLAWLDDQAAGSVIYLSFGTQAHVKDAQLDEILHGLARSGHPFLWAVRCDTWSPPVDSPHNGLVARGWVPQRSVLAHASEGGFVSHCGWNSVMESLAAGKPLLAWPMIAEQHLNARHVANVLGVGVRMDVRGGMEGVVGRGEVEEKVRELMDADSKKGKRMREKAAWAQQEAKSAVSAGGSSTLALDNLLEELQKSYGDHVIANGAVCSLVD
ncbi:hypothetical protein PR202_gb27791 [Eleusine coracana subsp. coracana]|uniref:Glycosyltransferase n=1 Tax=Eleusine coracana subsp. coracana TaxID=191504 RepID=A0AAV5FVC8_ELECO|nr:hypothetical protein PR202_gb27791 [Eleusine coracana subsp. coracana]